LIGEDTFLGLAFVNIANLKKFYEDNNSDETRAKEFVTYGKSPSISENFKSSKITNEEKSSINSEYKYPKPEWVNLTYSKI